MTKHNHSTVEIVLNPLFHTLSVQLLADKMGMKPNCICVGVCVGICVGSVWTVLHITIRSIVVGDGNGNGDGDGIRQCEHTITQLLIHVSRCDDQIQRGIVYLTNSLFCRSVQTVSRPNKFIWIFSDNILKYVKNLFDT